MHGSSQVGAVLVAAGVLLVLIGLLAWSGALHWFGRLPGDLRFEGEQSRVYIPLTSGLVVSIVVTLLVRLFAHLFR